MVSADASTLCEGWSAHHLAAHLWSLDHAIGAAVLQGAGPLAPLGHRWLAAIVGGHPYHQLVSELAGKQSGFTCMPDDRLTNHRHSLGEWFVHGEDLRRANHLPALETPAAVDEQLWLRLREAARVLLRRERRSVLLNTPDGRRLHVAGGDERIVVTGTPGELMLWIHGRRKHALVTHG